MTHTIHHTAKRKRGKQPPQSTIVPYWIPLIPQNCTRLKAPLRSSRSSPWLPCPPAQENSIAPASEIEGGGSPPKRLRPSAGRPSDIRTPFFENHCSAWWASNAIWRIGCSAGASLRYVSTFSPIASLIGNNAKDINVSISPHFLPGCLWASSDFFFSPVTTSAARSHKK
jgi:hypothetical protein